MQTDLSAGVPMPIVSTSCHVSVGSGWQPDFGGFTCYVAKGEDDEVSKVQHTMVRCIDVL